ncbi:MAG TPA: hypothetical protein VHW60_11380 [Caulobacteraceae bacterium]|jgi:hypothetical protein|nr:hypothetical protein [Caulobacteraceae bacterium]
MANPDEPDQIEGQDLAEVFDEENITEDGRDIATSDMQADVYDVVTSDEDATDALAPEDDFDPDAADEAELEEIVMAEEDLDEPRSFARGDSSLVADDDPQPADFEAGEAEDAETLEAEHRAAQRTDLERRLDRALEGTFPASDPVSISRSSS